MSGLDDYHDTRVFYDGTNEYYPWIFSKTLFHEANGMVLKSDIKKVVKCLKGTSDDLNNIPLHGSSVRKFEGIVAGNSINHMDINRQSPPTVTPYDVDSKKSIFEIMEVYGMSTLRDVPFETSDPKKTSLLTALNDTAFDESRTAPIEEEESTITEKSLLRGNGKDELVGPYVSQLLYLPFNYGNLTIDQKFKVEDDQSDSTTLVKWYEIQNGITPGGVNDSGQFKYIYTPRVLGSVVHNDPLYQFYYNAALIMYQNGCVPESWESDTTTAWTSTGPPDILAALAHVSLGALRVAWHNKWKYMVIRPEVMAYRIHHGLLVDTDIPDKTPGYRTMLNNIPATSFTFLDTYVKPDANTYLLKGQYPEGSPTHPSFPAGHAVVAGACVTVLKAMVKCHEGTDKIKWIAEPRTDAKHSLDGDVLVTYSEGDESKMTLVGELNKLASNVALGRDWAGVHYRADGDKGLLLGEKYAIGYLQMKAREYYESKNSMFNGWTLEKFSGELVKVNDRSVVSL